MVKQHVHNVEIHLFIHVSVCMSLHSSILVFVCLQPTTYQQASQPTNQPNNRSTNQPINQLTKQSTDQPTSQPNQSTNQPVNQQTNHAINHSTEPPPKQPTNQQINPLTYLPILVLRTKDNPQTDNRRSAKLLRTLQQALHIVLTDDG